MKSLDIHGREVGSHWIMQMHTMVTAMRDSAVRTGSVPMAADLSLLGAILSNIAEQMDPDGLGTGDAPGEPVAPQGTDEGPAIPDAPNGEANGSGDSDGPPAECHVCHKGSWHHPGKRRALVTWKAHLICSVCLMEELT